MELRWLSGYRLDDAAILITLTIHEYKAYMKIRLWSPLKGSIKLSKKDTRPNFLKNTSF